jgi:hypothetical protein
MSDAMRKCPDELTGRNSVMPWMAERTNISKNVIAFGPKTTRTGLIAPGYVVI